MSKEILFLIMFIISIFIISKICNISTNKIVLYIIIILIIINFIKKYNIINESFTDKISNLCNIVKNNFNKVVNKTSSKCIKDTNKDSKQQINDAIDCYNFTGNEIVSSNNVSSWCDLNSVDIDIIDKAIEKI
jgi:c-di-AMP phosphodiesterase-like protein